MMTPQPGASRTVGVWQCARPSSPSPCSPSLPATAAADDLVVKGRGWGHGVGLSQYGAYGYALREGRDHRFILAHYYAGTGYGTAPARRIRVRLKRARAPKLSGASTARAANGRRVRLAEARTYRFCALGPDRVEVVDTSTGRTRARLRAPVTVTGGATTTLRGTAENGLSQRRLPRRRWCSRATAPPCSPSTGSRSSATCTA